MTICIQRNCCRKWKTPCSSIPFVLWTACQVFASCAAFGTFGMPRRVRLPSCDNNNNVHTCLAMKSDPFHWIVPEGIPFGTLYALQFRPMPSNRTNTSTNSKYEVADGTGLCTVSTRAIGLNFADIFCILGLYTAANQIRENSAFCPGLEYAGIVVDDPTGTHVSGQRVLGFTRFGAYSDVVQVPPYFLYPLPDDWSFVQGAAFLVQSLTAWHGLVEIGRMPKSEGSNEQKLIVLVHSAAGGVGLWASEIAARRGAIVVGLVGSANKDKVFKDRILPLSPQSRAMTRGDERDFGSRLADLLSDIHGVEIPENVSSKKKLEYMREAGNGIDFVMESLGGQYFSESFEALNRGGSLVTFGSTSYVSPGLSINRVRLIWRFLTRPRIDPGTLTARNIRLAGFNLIYLTDKPSQLRRELRECVRCLNGSDGENDNGDEIATLDNVTPPIIGDKFQFRTGTIEALERLKSGATVGKVVLENNQNE